jgi:hypothetical protein
MTASSGEEQREEFVFSTFLRAEVDGINKKGKAKRSFKAGHEKFGATVR